MYLFVHSFLTVLGICYEEGFPLVVESGGQSSLRCVGFSLGAFSCEPWALGRRLQ